MKIYLLTQSERNGWDTYDSCIVCAENETQAKKITPNGYEFEKSNYGSWASCVEMVNCVEIGTANELQKEGLILASFNAG